MRLETVDSRVDHVLNVLLIGDWSSLGLETVHLYTTLWLLVIPCKEYATISAVLGIIRANNQVLCGDIEPCILNSGLPSLRGQVCKVRTHHMRRWQRLVALKKHVQRRL